MDDTQFLSLLHNYVACHGPDAADTIRATEEAVDNPESINNFIRIIQLTPKIHIKRWCATLLHRCVAQHWRGLAPDVLQRTIDDLLRVFVDETNFEIQLLLSGTIKSFYTSKSGNPNAIGFFLDAIISLFDRGFHTQAVLLASPIPMLTKSYPKDVFYRISTAAFLDRAEIDEPTTQKVVLILKCFNVGNYYFDHDHEFLPLDLFRRFIQLAQDADQMTPKLYSKFWQFISTCMTRYKQIIDNELVEAFFNIICHVATNKSLSTSFRNIPISHYSKIMHVYPNTKYIMHFMRIQVDLTMTDVKYMLSIDNYNELSCYTSVIKKLRGNIFIPQDKLYLLIKSIILRLLDIQKLIQSVTALLYLSTLINYLPEFASEDFEFVSRIIFDALNSNVPARIYTGLQCVYFLVGNDQDRKFISYYSKYIGNFIPTVKSFAICKSPEIMKLSLSILHQQVLNTNSIDFEFFYNNREILLRYEPDFYYYFTCSYLLTEPMIPDEFLINFLKESLPKMEQTRENNNEEYALIFQNVMHAFMANEFLYDMVWPTLKDNLDFIFSNIQLIFQNFNVLGYCLCIAIINVYFFSKILGPEMIQQVQCYFPIIMECILPFMRIKCVETSHLEKTIFILSRFLEFVPDEQVIQLGHTLTKMILNIFPNDNESNGSNESNENDNDENNNANYTNNIYIFVRKIINRMASEDVLVLLNIYFRLFNVYFKSETKIEESMALFPAKAIKKCKIEIKEKVYHIIHQNLIDKVIINPPEIIKDKSPFFYISQDIAMPFHDTVTALISTPGGPENVKWINIYLKACNTHPQEVYYYGLECFIEVIKKNSIPKEKQDQIAVFVINKIEETVSRKSISDFQNTIFLLNTFVTVRNEIVLQFLNENIEKLTNEETNPIFVDEEYDEVENLRDNIASLYLNFATLSPNLIHEKLNKSVFRFLPKDSSETSNFVKSLLALSDTSTSFYYQIVSPSIFIVFLKLLSLSPIMQKEVPKDYIPMIKERFVMLTQAGMPQTLQEIHNKLINFPSHLKRIENILANYGEPSNCAPGQ